MVSTKYSSCHKLQKRYTNARRVSRDFAKADSVLNFPARVGDEKSFVLLYKVLVVNYGQRWLGVLVHGTNAVNGSRRFWLRATYYSSSLPSSFDKSTRMAKNREYYRFVRLCRTASIFHRVHFEVLKSIIDRV